MAYSLWLIQLSTITAALEYLFEELHYSTCNIINAKLIVRSYSSNWNV